MGKTEGEFSPLPLFIINPFGPPASKLLCTQSEPLMDILVGSSHTDFQIPRSHSLIPSIPAQGYSGSLISGNPQLNCRDFYFNIGAFSDYFSESTEEI